MFYDLAMYSMYTTESFILKNIASGEADRIYTILTRDLGLVRGYAQGIRKLDSKLRYCLQNFSLAELSLVRGKDRWRITNAALIKNVSADLREEAAARAILGRVAALVFRLVPGEGKNELLYEHFKSAVLFLSNVHPSGPVLQNVEYLLVLRILHSLGYLGASPDWSIFTASPTFETDLLMRIEESKRQAIGTINKSLKASHL